MPLPSLDDFQAILKLKMQPNSQNPQATQEAQLQPQATATASVPGQQMVQPQP